MSFNLSWSYSTIDVGVTIKNVSEPIANSIFSELSIYIYLINVN